MRYVVDMLWLSNGINIDQLVVDRDNARPFGEAGVVCDRLGFD